MKVNHILIPTDFSTNSEVALKVAGEFTDFFGCTVDLIHCVPLMKYFSESLDPLGVPFSLEDHLYPHSIENSYKKLEELAQKYIKKEYRGKLISVIERKSSDAIIAQSKKEPYDLILMSAKGLHNSIHLLGGTTEKVIRNNNIPVMSLNETFTSESLKTILVPVDFSDSSLFGIIPAFELAKELGANIHLINVVELYSAGNDMMAYVPTQIDVSPIYEKLVIKIKEYLFDHPQYKLHLERSGVPYEDEIISTEEPHLVSVRLVTRIVKGVTAYREIIDYAKDNADIVVMNTHGRKGIARVFIGSTAEHVSRLIEKPLLVVRPQFYEEAVER